MEFWIPFCIKTLKYWTFCKIETKKKKITLTINISTQKINFAFKYQEQIARRKKTNFSIRWMNLPFRLLVWNYRRIIFVCSAQFTLFTEKFNTYISISVFFPSLSFFVLRQKQCFDYISSIDFFFRNFSCWI